MSQTVGDVQRAARETGHGAKEVLIAANDLSAQTENLTTHVDRFVGNIRAG